MKNFNIKHLIEKLDEKARYIDEDGFVRKPRNDIGLLFLSIEFLLIYILDNFRSELDIVVLFLFAYLCYLAIKYYSSHDIGTWKYSRHVRLWICIGCFITLFFLPYFIPILVGIAVYYYMKRKERKYLAKHKSELASNEAELSGNVPLGINDENEYNKWIKRIYVVAGGFLIFFGLSYGLQYYFESGLLLVFIREVLIILLGGCLILLGLFPGYLDAKLSSLINIKSNYPIILVNLIILLN